MRCFVDTTLLPFVFEPSPEEQSKFTQWNLEAEQRYFQNMGASLNGTMSFIDSVSNKIISSGPPSTAAYFMSYVLYVPHGEGSAPRTVHGNMELYMVEDSLHRWSIYRWVDKKIAADSTWSYLKAWFNR